MSNQPWGNLTKDELVAVLAKFDIHERPVGPNGEMGYLREDFEPVWEALGITDPDCFRS